MSEISLDSSFSEHVIVKVRGSHGKNLNLCNIYHNPNSQELSELLMGFCCRTKEDFSIVGDFNLEDSDWTNYIAPALSSQLLIRVIRDNYSFQLIENPTTASGSRNNVNQKGKRGYKRVWSC